MKTNPIFRLIALVTMICCSLPDAVARQIPGGEFNGPFDSWSDVTKSGATGNGRTDDTKAIQNVLDNLTDERFGINANAHTSYSVVYFPKGTYRITKPLKLTKKAGIIITGEDPEATILLFDGTDGGTILYADGSSYFRISRLQFRSNNKRNIHGIGIHWASDYNSSTAYAPQGMEISECIFNDGLARGIAGGSFGKVQKDATCSEVSVRNCHFYNCSVAGIGIQGYNALNYWIWNCRFTGCNKGVDIKYGNAYVYRSWFKGSLKADVYNSHGYYSSIRGCYSDSSACFYMDDSFSCNPFKRVLEGNVVKNTLYASVEYSDFGYLTLVNNYFHRIRNKDIQIAVNVVSRNGICNKDGYKIFSIGNFFDMPQPYRINKVQSASYDYTVGDYGFGKQSSGLDEKKFQAEILLPFNPRVKRQVFEVPANATDVQIQAIINEASGNRWKGKRPVVHIPAGKYNISNTIIIPAGSDVQIVGDGFFRASVLRGTPALRDNYFFKVKGPSAASITEIQIGWETGKDEIYNGILLENADQKDAHIFIDQMRAPTAKNSLHVNKLMNAYVQKTNSYYAYRDLVTGSAAHLNGKATSSVHLFGGQFGFFNVSNKASYFVKDTWYEGSLKEGVPFQASGNGNIVIDCARLGVLHNDRGTNPILKLKDFSGNFLLMNAYVDNTLSVDMKKITGNVLLMNLYMNFAPDIQNAGPTTSKRFSMIGVVAQDKDGKSYAVKEVANAAATRALMQKMTNYTKDWLPRYYTTKPAGVTNLYFSRITFGNLRTAYSMQP
ncbi:MAG: glycosyl hydrolase family 28-related protein [Pseudobacter sp.]|uniref:glycosyl hydrolase family 28-related protein n=1 Tax=Pseudobacter sp. TaxID=2045420 RepID=UPI003F8096A0